MRMTEAIEGCGWRRGWSAHRTGDGHLGQLEGDGTDVTHDTRPDLIQFQLQAGQ